MDFGAGGGEGEGGGDVEDFEDVEEVGAVGMAGGEVGEDEFFDGGFVSWTARRGAVADGDGSRSGDAQLRPQLARVKIASSSFSIFS